VSTDGSITEDALSPADVWMRVTAPGTPGSGNSSSNTCDAAVLRATQSNAGAHAGDVMFSGAWSVQIEARRDCFSPRASYGVRIWFGGKLIGGSHAALISSVGNGSVQGGIEAHQLHRTLGGNPGRIQVQPSPVDAMMSRWTDLSTGATVAVGKFDSIDISVINIVASSDIKLLSLYLRDAHGQMVWRSTADHFVPRVEVSGLPLDASPCDVAID